MWLTLFYWGTGASNDQCCLGTSSSTRAQQTHQTKVVHGNWSDKHSNWPDSDTWLSVLLVLLELYYSSTFSSKHTVPFPLQSSLSLTVSVTHTHTPFPIYNSLSLSHTSCTLSLCVLFVVFNFRSNRTGDLSKKITASTSIVLTDWWFSFNYNMLILTGKIRVNTCHISHSQSIVKLAK